MLMEQPAEIQRILISNDPCNLIDGVSGCLKQHLSIGNAYGCNKLHGCLAGVLFEIADKPAHAHSSGRGIFFYIYIAIIIRVEIGSC